MDLRLKRIYDDPAADDGFRILVDRLWPRGVSRERASLNLWLKEIAPSTELRKWFDHRASDFDEFSARYLAELDHNEAIEEFRRMVGSEQSVTLLFAAKNVEANHAVVLAQYLLS